MLSSDAPLIAAPAPRPLPRLVPIGLAVGAAGALAWLVRWLVQAQPTVWSDVARTVYVPDATLGWTQSDRAFVWLGLDGLVLVGAVLAGTVVMLLTARRLPSRFVRLRRVARALSLVGATVACAAPVVPVWAFVSGLPPAGAEIVLPDRPAPIPGEAIGIAARQLVVVDDAKANLLAVRIDAGGETFDARFSPISGAVDLDRRAGWLSVPAASIETGVGLRDSHAKGYLAADRFPVVRLDAGDIALAKDGSFTARGRLALMGKDIAVDVRGSGQVLDAAHRAELGLTASEALVVNVNFVVPISATALDPKNFDSDRLGVTARVVLVPAQR